MKVISLNTFPYKSTGRIMMSIHDALRKNGIDSYVAWGRGRKADAPNEFYMNDPVGVGNHALYTRITDRTGFASSVSTGQLLKWIDDIKPDVIHLHNIHGYYVNIEMLFNYIRKNKIQVLWTLHDCWPMTGHCAYFDMIKCDRWKTGCHDCPQLKTYPAAFFMDASGWNWTKKRELFSNQNTILITPSRWLKERVEESYLCDFPVEVIANGINTDIFSPTTSRVREKYNIQNKLMVIGVANEWTERKGLKDFLRLDSALKRLIPEQYVLVLIGLNKEQQYGLSERIIAIEKTSDAKELAELYSAADVLYNPTYEDNYPTVNLESICCGTPVITYYTGGSPESVDELVGKVFDQGAVDEVARFIAQNRASKLGYQINTGIFRLRYGENAMNEQYLKLYEKMGGGYLITDILLLCFVAFIQLRNSKTHANRKFCMLSMNPVGMRWQHND